MRNGVRLFLDDRRGNAAVEMALVLPLLLMLIFSFVEAGNYVMTEHGLVKAVRDGARFAARQDFSYYTGCSGAPDNANVVVPTQNIVIHGLRTGGSKYLAPNISAADITVSTSCASTAGGQNMKGIYTLRANGGQVVTVSATVPYRPLIGAFGFTGIGFDLYAASQAAVTGL